MKNAYLIIIAVLFAVILWGCKEQVQEVDRSAVQEAMKSFIQNRLMAQGGTYNINGMPAEFDHLHEGVNKVEGFYVSCADFKAGDDVYDIDLYVKAGQGKYVVVKEVIHKKNGEVIGEILWEQESN